MGNIFDERRDSELVQARDKMSLKSAPPAPASAPPAPPAPAKAESTQQAPPQQEQAPPPSPISTSIPFVPPVGYGVVPSSALSFDKQRDWFQAQEQAVMDGNVQSILPLVQQQTFTNPYTDQTMNSGEAAIRARQWQDQTNGNLQREWDSYVTYSNHGVNPATQFDETGNVIHRATESEIRQGLNGLTSRLGQSLKAATDSENWFGRVVNGAMNTVMFGTRAVQDLTAIGVANILDAPGINNLGDSVAEYLFQGDPNSAKQHERWIQQQKRIWSTGDIGQRGERRQQILQQAPVRNTVSDFDDNLLGKVFYTLSLPENVVMGAVYEFADTFLRMRGQDPGINPGGRIARALYGQDLSILNRASNEKYLGWMEPEGTKIGDKTGNIFWDAPENFQQTLGMIGLVPEDPRQKQNQLRWLHWSMNAAPTVAVAMFTDPPVDAALGALSKWRKGAEVAQETLETAATVPGKLLTGIDEATTVIEPGKLPTTVPDTTVAVTPTIIPEGYSQVPTATGTTLPLPTPEFPFTSVKGKPSVVTPNQDTAEIIASTLTPGVPARPIDPVDITLVRRSEEDLARMGNRFGVKPETVVMTPAELRMLQRGEADAWARWGKPVSDYIETVDSINLPGGKTLAIGDVYPRSMGLPELPPAEELVQRLEGAVSEGLDIDQALTVTRTPEDLGALLAQKEVNNRMQAMLRDSIPPQTAWSENVHLLPPALNPPGVQAPEVVDAGIRYVETVLKLEDTAANMKALDIQFDNLRTVDDYIQSRLNSLPNAGRQDFQDIQATRGMYGLDDMSDRPLTQEVPSTFDDVALEQRLGELEMQKADIEVQQAELENPLFTKSKELLEGQRTKRNVGEWNPNAIEEQQAKIDTLYEKGAPDRVIEREEAKLMKMQSQDPYLLDSLEEQLGFLNESDIDTDTIAKVFTDVNRMLTKEFNQLEYEKMISDIRDMVDKSGKRPSAQLQPVLEEVNREMDNIKEMRPMPPREVEPEEVPGSIVPPVTPQAKAAGKTKSKYPTMPSNAELPVAQIGDDYWQHGTRSQGDVRTWVSRNGSGAHELGLGVYFTQNRLVAEAAATKFNLRNVPMNVNADFSAPPHIKTVSTVNIQTVLDMNHLLSKSEFDNVFGGAFLHVMDNDPAQVNAFWQKFKTKYNGELGYIYDAYAEHLAETLGHADGLLIRTFQEQMFDVLQKYDAGVFTGKNGESMLVVYNPARLVNVNVEDLRRGVNTDVTPPTPTAPEPVTAQPTPDAEDFDMDFNFDDLPDVEDLNAEDMDFYEKHPTVANFVEDSHKYMEKGLGDKPNEDLFLEMQEIGYAEEGDIIRVLPLDVPEAKAVYEGSLRVGQTLPIGRVRSWAKPDSGVIKNMASTGEGVYDQLPNDGTKRVLLRSDGKLPGVNLKDNFLGEKEFLTNHVLELKVTRINDSTEFDRAIEVWVQPQFVKRTTTEEFVKSRLGKPQPPKTESPGFKFNKKPEMYNAMDDLSTGGDDVSTMGTRPGDDMPNVDPYSVMDIDTGLDEVDEMVEALEAQRYLDHYTAQVVASDAQQVRHLESTHELVKYEQQRVAEAMGEEFNRHSEDLETLLETQSSLREFSRAKTEKLISEYDTATEASAAFTRTTTQVSETDLVAEAMRKNKQFRKFRNKLEKKLDRLHKKLGEVGVGSKAHEKLLAEIDDLTRKVADVDSGFSHQIRVMKALAGRNPTTGMDWQKMNEFQRLADLQNLNPNWWGAKGEWLSRSAFEKARHRVQQFAARYIDSELGGDAGKVRDQLFNLKRVGQGQFASMLADIEASSRIKGAWKDAQAFLKSTGVKIEQYKFSELMTEMMELQHSPYLMDEQFANTQVAKFLQAKLAETYKLGMSYGLSQSQLDELGNIVREIPQVYHEVLDLSKKMGMNFGDEVTLGYLPRELNETVQFMIQGNKVVHTNESAAAFKKSRSLFHYVPEDSVLMEQVLDTVNSKWRETLNVKSFDELIGREGDSKLLAALNGILNEDDLDMLNEMGVLRKIPFTQVESAKFIAQKYDLPFNNLTRIYMSDPATAFQLYKKGLQDRAAKSATANGLLGAIGEMGWHSTEASPAPKGWVKFSELGLGSYVPEDFAKYAEDFHVHPMVAEELQAMFYVNTSPGVLSFVGDIASVLYKYTAGTMLFTPKWAVMQVLGNSTNLVKRGINPQLFFINVWKQLQLEPEQFVKGLGTSKDYLGGTVSEQELWQLGVKLGILDVDEMVYGTATGGGKFNPKESAGEFINYIMKGNYHRDFGEGTKIEDNYLKGIVDRLVSGSNSALDSTIYRVLDKMNKVTDNSMKFALLQAVTKDNQGWVKHLPGSFLTGSPWGFRNLPKFSDPVEAAKWVRQASYTFDQIPTNEKYMRYILPFYSFQRLAFAETARWVAANPGKFASYVHIVSATQNNFEEEDSAAWEALMGSGWMADSMPIPVKIPADQSASGEDEYYVFPLATLAPSAGALQFPGRVAGMFGISLTGQEPSPKDSKANPFAGRTGSVADWFREEGSPFARQLLALADPSFLDQYADRDDTTVEERTNYPFGMNRTSWAYTKLWAPWVSTLVKLSPEVIKGRPARVNPRTGTFEEGTPDFLGNVPTSLSGGNIYGNSGFFDGFMQAIGTAPVSFDMLLQQGFSMTEIKSQLYTLEKDAKRIHSLLRNPSPGYKKEDLERQLSQLQIVSLHLRAQYDIYREWRRLNDLPHPRALKQIEQANLKVDKLLPESERQRIYRENWERYSRQFQ